MLHFLRGTPRSLNRFPTINAVFVCEKLRTIDYDRVESRKFLRLAFPAPPSVSIVCSSEELCTFARRLNWRADENPAGERRESYREERVGQTDKLDKRKVFYAEGMILRWSRKMCECRD